MNLWIKLITLFALAGLIPSNDAIAQQSPLDQPDARYCSLNIPEKPYKTVSLPYGLSFFISPNPNGKEVAVIAGFANRLVDISSMPDGGRVEMGRQDTELPGYVDPVFTPDGKYITLPSSQFFKYSEAKKKGDDAKPMMKQSYGAPYQSIGQPNLRKEEYLSLIHI